MQTRSSHNWATKSGTWDALKTEYIDFYSDYPIINCKNIDNGIVVNCNDYKRINEFSLVSTFLDDYILERFWNNPKKYIAYFKNTKGVMSPDFSLLIGMPLPLQQYNVYRNRLVGYIWQKYGVNVIPTVSWSDERSFDFCFKGVEKSSIVAVSNIGCNNSEQKAYFDKGFAAMIDVINPSKILFCCNKRHKNEYKSKNIVFINSFWNNKLIKNQ